MGRIRRRGTAYSALAVTIGVTGAIGWTAAGSAAAQSCLSVNGNNIGAGVARLNSTVDVGAGNGNNDTAVGIADNGSHANVTASFGDDNTSVGVAGDHGFLDSHAGQGTGNIATAIADNATVIADA